MRSATAKITDRPAVVVQATTVILRFTASGSSAPRIMIARTISPATMVAA